MSSDHTVLVVSRDEDLIAAVRSALNAKADYRVLLAEDDRAAAQQLDGVAVNLVLCDLDCVPDAADNILTRCRVSHPGICRIAIGSPGDGARGSELARRSAAYLHLFKPLLADQIALVVKRGLEMNELSRRHRLLSRELKISVDDQIFGERSDLSVKGGYSQFEKLVYASTAMADLIAEARKAATTDLPVLIEGETGTGKELLARAIHFNSSRVDSPMHVQNCGGMLDSTLHSELFGHVRGAFTGATTDRLGLFRAADGGTVFLDEISDVSASFQVSLLRFLQGGEVKPLGSDKIVHANVRIIAASNRPLAQMVEQGEFRRDLYYRLKGFALHIPPLRARREDIPTLTDFFVEKYAGVVGRRVIGITQLALARLQAYSWPGNVRELESEIRRAVALAESGGYISDRNLSEVFDNIPIQEDPIAAADVGEGSLKDMVELLEQRVLSATLTRLRWNQSRAAEALGLSRVGLANKIKRYGLDSD
jgi:two-component system response regulator HupR/HoxA